MPTINENIAAVEQKRVEREVSKRIRTDRTNAILARLVASDYPRFLEIGDKLTAVLNVFNDVRNVFDGLRETNAEIELETAQDLLEMITDLNAEIGPLTDELDMSEYVDQDEVCVCCQDERVLDEAFSDLRKVAKDLFGAAVVSMSTQNKFPMFHSGGSVAIAAE